MKDYTPKIPKPTVPRIKSVKRSYKKGSSKTPKASVKNVSKAKAKKPARSSSSKAIKTHKKTSTKAPKRTRAEIMASAAEKRQQRFEAYQEREAQREIREYEKYLDTEKSTYALLREMDRADRELKKAERAYAKEQRYQKAKAITENKIKAENRDPQNYRESVMAMISDKLYDYGFTSPEHRQQLADIVGMEVEEIDFHDDADEETFKEYMYATLDSKNLDERELTKAFRQLESYGRKERLHVKGIEEDMDVETAKIVYADIMASASVSKETKEVLKLLGPKGALIYVNYRQIMKMKFGNNYKEMFYNEAAETFWDGSGDNVSLKKYGYKFSKAARGIINDSSVALSNNFDASNLAKFAMTTMNPDEANEFLSNLHNVEGFDKKMRVEYINGKRKVNLA